MSREGLKLVFGTIKKTSNNWHGAVRLEGMKIGNVLGERKGWGRWFYIPLPLDEIPEAVRLYSHEIVHMNAVPSSWFLFVLRRRLQAAILTPPPRDHLGLEIGRVPPMPPRPAHIKPPDTPPMPRRIENVLQGGGMTLNPKPPHFKRPDPPPAPPAPKNRRK